MQGGLARRAGLINEVRKQNNNVLLLDGGDSYSIEKNVPELRAEISMEGLSMMKYDALNLADGELSLGLEFLEKVRDKATFPLLSANIFKKGAKEPLGKPYLIKKFPGFKVAMIGLASPIFFRQELLAKETLEIKDPETTLRELLPKVRPQADIVVLLSHLGKEPTRVLVQNVPGIDVALVGHDTAVMHDPEQLGKTLLLQNSLRGEFLGMLDLMVDRKQGIQVQQHRMEKISQTTPSDPEVLALLRTFEEKKAAIDREKMAERKKLETDKKLRDGLNMTPEEFFEKMKREQPEQFMLPGATVPDTVGTSPKQ